MQINRRAFLVGAAAGAATPLRAQQFDFDLLVRGGTVIDPSQSIHAALDVGIKNGVVVSIEASIDPGRAGLQRNRKACLPRPG